MNAIVNGAKPSKLPKPVDIERPKPKKGKHAPSEMETDSKKIAKFFSR